MRFLQAWPVGCAAVLAALLSSQPAGAAPFQNGSFEASAAFPGPIGSFVTLFGGSTAIDGWTVFPHSIDYIGGYWQPSHGARSLDLSGNAAGSIRQNFDTVLGDTYLVLFDMAGNPDGGQGVKDSTVTAALDTQSYMFTVGATNTKTNMGWKTQSFIFVATNTTTTLSFTSDENNPFGAALDNVRVAAIPEPASLTLLGLGIVGLAGHTWRRRKPQAA